MTFRSISPSSNNLANLRLTVLAETPTYLEMSNTDFRALS